MSLDEMSRGSLSGVFPPGREVLFRTLSCLSTFLGLSLISFCFAHRMVKLGLLSSVGYRSLTPLKAFMILLLVDSWLFLLAAGIFINGLGTSLNARVCRSVTIVCLSSYSLGKSLIYLMLSERLYVVWPHRGTRRSSLVWKIGIFVTLGYIAVSIIMAFRQFPMIRNDLQCVVFASKETLTVALSCDFGGNLLLTGLFLWPLRSKRGLSPELRRIASRTMIATILYLAMTTANILTLLPGYEFTWICLTACSLDLCGNTIVMFWLTRPTFKRSRQQPDKVSTSASTGFHVTRTTKTYQLETAFRKSISSRSPADIVSTGGRTDIAGQDHSKYSSTGDVLADKRRSEPQESLVGGLWDLKSSSRVTLDLDMDQEQPFDDSVHFQDDLDIALAGQSDAANDVFGRRTR